MENYSAEDVANALGKLTVLEVIALTKKLETQWGVKAEPAVVVQQAQVEKGPVQTEFTVVLASVPAESKMTVIKLVREVCLLGLKESKDLVEGAPKLIKEGVTADEAAELKRRLTEAGAVIEVK